MTYFIYGALPPVAVVKFFTKIICSLEGHNLCGFCKIELSLGGSVCKKPLGPC